MPRYFFSLRHTTLEPDLQGTELPDDQAAWGEAVTMLGEILREVDGKVEPGPEWRVEVARENIVIFSLRFQGEDYRQGGKLQTSF
jgi:hypothetical protein